MVVVKREMMAHNRPRNGKSNAPVKASFVEELRVYEANKTGWLSSHANDFVVICGEKVAGFFPTYAEAYAAAVSSFGFDRLFLIKQVLTQEQVYVVY